MTPTSQVGVSHAARQPSFRSPRYLRDRIEQILAAIDDLDVVHLSGITLSMLDANGRSLLHRGLVRVRAGGVFVVFDPNYRAILWADRREAAAATHELLPSVDAVLASTDDCAALFASRDAESGAIAQ